ncbi:MAG: ABC transporter substrate-binding protein, partial [Gordonia sp. (in: high G+C Gram-positive bacteria)]
MTPTRNPAVVLGTLISLGAIALSACSSGSDGSASGTAASSAHGGTPVTGGTFRLGILGTPQKLDPIEAASFSEGIIANNVIDKLVWKDPETGKVEPWLASSWTYNSNLTEFTFKLRKDVTFSDGTPFNAQVAKDNIDQRALGNSGLGLAADTGHFPNYASTTVVDPYTITVKFTKPNAGYLDIAGFEGNNPQGFVSESTLKLSATQR